MKVSCHAVRKLAYWEYFKPIKIESGEFFNKDIHW